MGDEDNAKAAFGRGPYVFEHHARLTHTQSRGGLIEDEHSGAVVHRTSNGHGLPLTTRQRADGLIDITNIDTHLGHLVLRGFAHECGAHQHTTGHGFSAKKEVSPHRHQRGHSEILIDGGDTAFACLTWRLELNGHAVDEVFASRRLVQARQNFDEGRLPCAVVAEHAGDRTRFNRGGDPFEGCDVSEVLGDALQFQE